MYAIYGFLNPLIILLMNQEVVSDMKFFNESALNSQSVTDQIAGKMVKVVPGACLTVFLAVAIFSSGTVSAGETAKGERLGGYTLTDESMLGRYGDVNDEWIHTSSVSVSNEQMSSTAKRAMPKQDNRLGAYSMEDEAMLGRYGDKDDGY